MKALLSLPILFVSTVVLAQGLQISPENDAALQGVLEKLAERHGRVVWCERDCVTFFEVRFSGSLVRGALRFEMSGVVTSDAKAYVRLFGTRPTGRFHATPAPRCPTTLVGW